MVWPAYLATAAFAYLIGAIPVGLVLGRLLKGTDIREHGSGRTGAGMPSGRPAPYFSDCISTPVSVVPSGFASTTPTTSPST